MTDARVVLLGLQITIFGGFLFLGDHYSLTPSVGYWLMVFGVLLSFGGVLWQAWEADGRRQAA